VSAHTTTSQPSPSKARPHRHQSLARGSFSTWPVWGGSWKWMARLNGAITRSGTTGSHSEARAEAVEALAQLNRERRPGDAVRGTVG
jgi:hypothetical protein